jgi:type I restriction enzyme M protein
VLRLPEGVFAPYTDIPTNVIFFDTAGPTRDVWFYEQPMPEGRRKYSKTRPIQFEEFADCMAWWNQREEGPQAWKVNGPELIRRDEVGRVVAVNLDLKNPAAKEAVDHRAPAEIVASVIEKERQVLALLDEIKALVAERVA